jgi:hypothetical protein
MHWAQVHRGENSEGSGGLHRFITTVYRRHRGFHTQRFSETEVVYLIHIVAVGTPIGSEGVDVEISDDQRPISRERQAIALYANSSEPLS